MASLTNQALRRMTQFSSPTMFGVRLVVSSLLMSSTLRCSGAITALIGPNGAGKTTFFNLLTNFDEPDTGDRLFEGNDLLGVSAYKVANLGMVRTFQLTKSLSKMTVIDNMRLGGTEQAGESFFGALLPFLWRRQKPKLLSVLMHCLNDSNSAISR